MTKEEYTPIYLEDVKFIPPKQLILDIRPQVNDSEDHYYEIHFESDEDVFSQMETYTYGYICIEINSPTHLTIYLGEFYEECGTDGEIPYQNYSFKTFEKGSPEWKPKYKALYQEFISIFKGKLIGYETTRNKIINNYRSAYDSQNCL